MTAPDLGFRKTKVEIGAAYDHAKHCSQGSELALGRFKNNPLPADLLRL